MKRDKEEFKESVRHCVEEYLGMPDIFDGNPQLRINPATLDVVAINGKDMLSEIADSDEAIEDAAIAQGAATELADDFQVTQDPEFYPIKELTRMDTDGRTVIDGRKVESLVKRYIG